tara:strand:+ start:35439 stop:36002 length:564 start_codon:yes stop_codon:yes gene_type:complete
MGLTACSSIVEGTDQSITVITNPSGASCTLEREGTSIAVVNPTPGTVTVDKSKNNIAVLCTKADHETSAGTLASSFEAMTFGNVLIGGFVGLAIDASSGALNKYPESITITVPPLSFPTEAARDAFYNALKTQVNASAAKAVAEITSSCGSENSDGCKSDIAVIETSRDAELLDLEAKRLRAEIGAG